MIEEEDEEAILNKGVSLSSVLKNLLVIAFILGGALFIYFGTEDIMMNYMIGFFLICIGSTIMQIQKEDPEPIKQTLTILTCPICGLTKVRNYEQGDYVFSFNAKDSCDKCNDSMEIKQIYSVKLKAPTEENEKKPTEKVEITK